VISIAIILWAGMNAVLLHQALHALLTSRCLRSELSDDWVFASPFKLGRLPWSYDQVWRV
jgi:hypothetical protein